MGIKFHCPNGHKLNVKAFLAGKKGVCPKCGTKVRIPLVSEAGLVDSEVEEGGDAPSVMINTASAAPAGLPVATGGNGASATATAVAAPALPPPPAPPATAHDPISEAPSAIWYVRPPSGGQYGPAKGDTMRSWLSEGRISSDSFVWRDGWTDWRIAGQLFPDLQGIAAPAVAIATPISTAKPALRQPTKQRGTGGLAVAILAGLGLMILVLLAALAYIIIAFR